MTWRRPRWRLRRRAARMVLLDPAGRVLLLRHAAVQGSAGSSSWYLPGGGRMPFEPAAAAARRELREETGIIEVAVGPVIGERLDVSFAFRGRRVVQDESYVAGRVPTPHVGTGRHGDGERRAVAAHRWWSPDELAATSDTVFPPELAELISRASAWAARAADQGVG